MSPAAIMMTPAEQIAARTVVGVEHVLGLGPCWEWDGMHNADGYALISLRNPRRSGRVHRVVFELEHGAITPGMHVDHRCFNHGCIRGAHLRELTPGQNNENRAGPTSASTTGARNVYLEPRTGRYFVTVARHRVRYHGGTFDTIEAAASAAAALREQVGMTR